MNSLEYLLMTYGEYIVLDVDGHYAHFPKGYGLFSSHDLAILSNLISFLNDVLFRDLN